MPGLLGGDDQPQGGILGVRQDDLRSLLDAANQIALGPAYVPRDPDPAVAQVAAGAGPTTAYHGSPYNFDRFDNNYLHPDEAGHYVTTNEGVARDYAGPGGHMYEVNVKADPTRFIDYGSLDKAGQDRLNDPDTLNQLQSAGAQGVRFPDGSMTVFDGRALDIVRKYRAGTE